MDKKKICNYGRVRYQPILPGKITDEFHETVKQLPTNYNECAYSKMIKKWGTVSALLSSFS